MLKGFIENLERIGISLGELEESIKPFPSLAIGKHWSKLEIVFFLSTGNIRYHIGMFIF